MNDSTGVHLHCTNCGTELGAQYFSNINKYFCRKCYTTYMLRTKQYQLISDNVCHCQSPIEISICPKCGKVRYATKKE